MIVFAPLARITAVLVLAVVVAVACTDAPPPPVTAPEPPPPAPPAEVDDGSFTVYGCAIASLLPQESRETCGGRVLVQLFSGLAELDPQTGEPRLVVAESITTDDATTWTIELHDGWTFHNGEAVTARSFVDAWNFAAHPDNGMRNADFFADVVGFDAVRAGDVDVLAGLRMVDELTIEVELVEPFVPFLAKLTDSAFYPLPSIAYEDLDAFDRHPVGNGRFELVSYDPDREVVLRRHEGWPGPEPALAREVVYLIYTGDGALQTAYVDVRVGALDVLDNVPPEHLASVDAEFGDRVVRTPTSALTMLGLPMYDERFGDNRDLRRALSLAIDRERIVAEALDGAATPATALIPPVLDAHSPGSCAYCRYDPALARMLFDRSGGWDGPLTVHYHTGVGAEHWIRDVIAQWQETLGIGEVAIETHELAPYLRMLDRRDVAGPFRIGWSLSYLSPEYALAELYRSTGGANFFGYENAAFDEALELANASDVGEAIARYREAESIVLDDLPVIPLWFGRATTVHTPRVEGVIVDASLNVRVERVRVLDALP
jgi:oligopeptide transport system substrate-binding protein